MPPVDLITAALQIMKKKESKCPHRKAFSGASSSESTGSVAAVNHDIELQKVQRKELPSDYEVQEVDVVCARGKGAARHNSYYNELLLARETGFFKTNSRSRRQAICSEIVQALRNKGACFIKRDKLTDSWWEIGDTKAREKVGHAIRDRLTSKGIAVRCGPQPNPAKHSGAIGGDTRKRSSRQDNTVNVSKRHKVDNSTVQKDSCTGSPKISSVDDMTNLVREDTGTMSNAPSFGCGDLSRPNQQFFRRNHNNGQIVPTSVGSQESVLSSAMARQSSYFQMLQRNIDLRMGVNPDFPFSMVLSPVDSCVQLSQQLQQQHHYMAHASITGGRQPGAITYHAMSNNLSSLHTPLTNPNHHIQQQQGQHQPSDLLGMGAAPYWPSTKQPVERPFSSGWPPFIPHMRSQPSLGIHDDIVQLFRQPQVPNSDEHQQQRPTVQGGECFAEEIAQSPSSEAFGIGLGNVDDAGDEQKLEQDDDAGLNEDHLLENGSPLNWFESDYSFP